MAVAAGALIVTAILLRGKDTAGGGASGGDLSQNSVIQRDFAMGSALSVTLYGETEKLETVSSAAIEKIRALDEQVISWRAENSELARWNRTAKAGEAAEVSEALSRAVTDGRKIWEGSGHVLDLTLRPVLDTWGIEEKDPGSFQVPSEQALADAAARCGMEHISVSEGILVRNREEILLDLGAIGKGYALDVVYDELLKGETPVSVSDGTEPEDAPSTPVMGGVVAVGGSVMIFGSKPDGCDYQVGIRDPEGSPEDIIGILSFRGGTGRHCISTSGGYEKFIEKDGVRYHHIIDPRTRKPADSGLKSVTVVCENGLMSDGLSTACFILGEDASREILRNFAAEAVFIREDGSIFVTEGLKDAWRLQP